MTLVKHFVKLEWMHKGVMSIPLFYEGISPAVDLIPRPMLLLVMTCNVEYLLSVIQRKCMFCLHHCKIS